MTPAYDDRYELIISNELLKVKPSFRQKMTSDILCNFLKHYRSKYKIVSFLTANHDGIVDHIRRSRPCTKGPSPYIARTEQLTVQYTPVLAWGRRAP
jgi:hypothetical protein